VVVEKKAGATAAMATARDQVDRVAMREVAVNKAVVVMVVDGRVNAAVGETRDAVTMDRAKRVVAERGAAAA
jgi:hypothetical protein